MRHSSAAADDTETAPEEIDVSERTRFPAVMAACRRRAEASGGGHATFTWSSTMRRAQSERVLTDPRSRAHLEQTVQVTPKARGLLTGGVHSLDLCVDVMKRQGVVAAGSSTLGRHPADEYNQMSHSASGHAWRKWQLHNVSKKGGPHGEHRLLGGAAHLSQDLTLAHHERVEARRHTEQVVRSVTVPEEEEVLLQLLHRHPRHLRKCVESADRPRHVGTFPLAPGCHSMRPHLAHPVLHLANATVEGNGDDVHLEAVAGAQDGSLLDMRVRCELSNGSGPLRLWRRELLAKGDGSVVDAEPNSHDGALGLGSVACERNRVSAT